MRSESVGIETMILNFAGNFVCAMQVDTEVFYSAKYRPGIIAG